MHIHTAPDISSAGLVLSWSRNAPETYSDSPCPFSQNKQVMRNNLLSNTISFRENGLVLFSIFTHHLLLANISNRHNVVGQNTRPDVPDREGEWQ